MPKKLDRDFGEIIREAVKLNNLSYKDIVEITERSENTVFKWLNGTLTPDEAAIYRVYLALYLAKMKIPREMARANSATFLRSKKWAKKHCTGLSKPTLVGEKINRKKYKYKGNLLTQKELTEVAGCARGTISRIVKSYGEGDDVTKIIDNIGKSGRGRKPKRQKC